MIEIFIGRVLLGWLQAIELRRADSCSFPSIPGYAVLIPGSPEKFPVLSPREFHHNILIQRTYSHKNRRLRGRIQEIPG
jgi:hypothetical protein